MALKAVRLDITAPSIFQTLFQMSIKSLKSTKFEPTANKTKIHTVLQAYQLQAKQNSFSKNKHTKLFTSTRSRKAKLWPKLLFIYKQMTKYTPQ
jgi:hypothetical protein